MAGGGSKKGSSLRAYLPVVSIPLAVIAIVGVVVWLVVSSMGDPAKPTKKFIQQVQIIRPPPPPETPPPPPEPEEVDVPEPEEPEPEVADADEPPAGDPLTTDAEGGAGGEDYGMNRGKPRLLGSGSGDQYKWYGQILKNDLIDRLAEIRDIRRDRYSVVVRLWLTPDGHIQRFSVVTSTGDKDLDRDLVAALESLERVSEPPPADLPQPVRLRIVSRI